MFYGLAIDRISDHLDECRDRWVLCDKALVPLFIDGADEHQLEVTSPDNAAPKPTEHRVAVSSVSGKGFGARRTSPIGIGRLVAKPHKIEHVDWARTIIGSEGGERLLYWIDMAGHLSILTERCSANICCYDGRERPNLSRPTTHAWNCLIPLQHGWRPHAPRGAQWSRGLSPASACASAASRARG